MEWGKLLSTQRIRQLASGVQSQPESGETRTELLRDYGRAVFCTPVRRLQDKAQVFPLERIDLVRTRLTHSLEVSSMARGLANGVGQLLCKHGHITPEQAYDIETIASTCALLHDIGNPPFGHFGEQAIRDWFSKQSVTNPRFWDFDQDPSRRLAKDLLNFEGNAQTLRLLSKLQVLSDRFGLNLTAATSSALCKYTASSTEIGADGMQSKKKLGYFTAEKELVELIRRETGTGDSRHPVSLLVEASDDIVYCVVDIEDAIKKNVIGWDCIREAVLKEGGHKGAELVQNAEKRIQSSPLYGSQNQAAREEGTAQFFRTLLMGFASNSVQSRFLEKYESIMDGTYEREILYDSEAAPIYSALKLLARNQVYTAKAILRLEVLGYRVIHSLLDVFGSADQGAQPTQINGKAYALMSQNYRAVYENPDTWESSLPSEYRRLLLLTDYICGMTDSFALTLHQELTYG